LEKSRKIAKEKMKENRERDLKRMNDEVKQQILEELLKDQSLH
jgi:hypothetical protein